MWNLLTSYKSSAKLKIVVHFILKETKFTTIFGIVIVLIYFPETIPNYRFIFQRKKISFLEIMIHTYGIYGKLC